MLAILFSAFLQAKEPIRPSSTQEKGHESITQSVQQWAESVKAHNWQQVYKLGSPYLRSKVGLKDKGMSRLIGFTWFAAYLESRAGRGKENALESIKNAFELIPDQNEIWYEYGSELNRNERYREAIEILRNYLGKVSGNLDGQYGLAYSYNGAGQPELALPILESLLKQSPDDPHVLSELGFSFNALGRGAEAQDALTKLLKIRPQDRGAWLELSHSYRLTEQWDLASQALDKSENLGLSHEQVMIEREQIASKIKAKWKTSVK